MVGFTSIPCRTLQAQRPDIEVLLVSKDGKERKAVGMRQEDQAKFPWALPKNRWPKETETAIGSASRFRSFPRRLLGDPGAGNEVQGVGQSDAGGRAIWSLCRCSELASSWRHVFLWGGGRRAVESRFGMIWKDLATLIELADLRIHFGWCGLGCDLIIFVGLPWQRC